MANNALTSTEFNKFVRSDKIQARMSEVFGKDAAANTVSIITLFNQNSQLQKCDANSILSAAVQAALIHLPLSSQLGYAYIVPYFTQGKMMAQLQIGWKGYVQLAMRSGQYATINADVVREGQLQNFNYVTGEFEIGEPVSDKVIGYFAYFRLVNGFQKMLYMTREQVENHAAQFSDGYKHDLKNGKSSSIWNKNFDAMATKTVLKRLISKYGIVSLEMQQALAADQAVIEKNQFTYVDNGNNVAFRDSTITVDTDTSQVADTPDDEDAPWEEFDTETGEVTEILDK